jgi:hypothetical protein
MQAFSGPQVGFLRFRQIDEKQLLVRLLKNVQMQRTRSFEE